MQNDILEESQSREQRRKKIKELESSLFGSNNEWSMSGTTTRDLPELKNVNEYASRLESVETRKGTQQPNSSLLGLTRLKTAATQAYTSKKSTSSTLFSNKKSKHRNSFDDLSDLLKNEVKDEDFKAAEETLQNLPPVNKRPLSRSQRLLKSEVAQLDEAFHKIFHEEPAQSVIENLKKKHGLLVNSNKYERFDEEHQEQRPSLARKSLADVEKINVEAFREKMSRAQILDYVPQTMSSKDKPRRSTSMNLSVIGKALPVTTTSPTSPDIKIDPSPKQKRSKPQLQDKSK